MQKNSLGWKKFLALCSNVKDEKMMESLFELLLTIDEREDIANRVMIVKELLAEKNTQRDIAEKLEVSISKITRGSNAMKNLKPQLVDYLHKYLDK